MLKIGNINLCNDHWMGKCIFFTDLQNLLKEWNKVDKNRGENLLECLLHHCSPNGGVVLLKCLQR